LESQKVQESFATQVAERLGETDERQARHEAVTSHLHEAVQGAGEQSMHRDLLLDQEIVRINEQHKRELAAHEITINLVRNELQHHQESREAQDGEIAVLKALVEQLLGQVKGKDKVSDPTPEASGAGGGRPPPPPPRHGAVGAPGGGGGGDPDDEGEGSGRKPDESGKGRRDETKREKEDYHSQERNLSCTTRVRRVEIQGNLTFPPSKKAGQIEAGGASIGHKVHARRMVSEGVSGVRPNSKVEVRWTRHSGQSHTRAKTTIKDRTS